MIPCFTDEWLRFMEAKEVTQSGTRAQGSSSVYNCRGLGCRGRRESSTGVVRSGLSLTSSQGQYRTVLYSHWVEKLVTHQVPHTSEPTLIGTLGSPVKIRSWQVLAPGG